VKGKGCTTLVGVEQGVREDVIESGMPMSQTDEDEEKFFDRISVEVLLAAMKINGFPDQGFLELKASGMEAKTVEIVTCKGVAHAKFVCGLEQGNPDSPTIANLVIKLKHDVWANLLKATTNDIITLRDTVKKRGKAHNDIQAKNSDAYKMHIVDEEDGPVLVDRIGYCDDNSRYTCSIDENEVIKLTKLYIQHASDLSLVTKIGRKGSKSETHYFNLSAATAWKLEKINSIAWSFAVDGPKLESVPFKIFLQPTEKRKLYDLAQVTMMGKIEKEKFDDIFNPKAHKHLGLRSTLNADTSAASKEIMNKIKARMSDLNIHNLENEAQRLCTNMLCNTMHSYAPLQMAHPVKELEICDDILINYVRLRNGLSKTDAKHPIFLDTARGGCGFRSFLDTDIMATARELEILLNGIMLDSKIMRSRSKAFLIRHDRPDGRKLANFTGSAINKIASLGLYVRDSHDGIVNYVLSEISKLRKYASVGTTRYRDGRSNHSTGAGNGRNLEIAFGSELHVFLKKAIDKDGNLKENIIAPTTFKLPVSLTRIKKILPRARIKMFEDRCALYNCWEWDGSKSAQPQKDYQNAHNWKFINVSQKIREQYASCYWTLEQKQIHEIASHMLDISEKQHIMEKLRSSKGPAIIATDGSHIPPILSTDKPINSGAATLCTMDIKAEETMEDNCWLYRPSIPLFARATRLPDQIGTTPTDIAHGEGIALCLGLEMMKLSGNKVIVMDSAAVRDTALNLRRRQLNQGSDRVYIRKMIAGLSKCICSRIESSLTRQQRQGKHESRKLQRLLKLGRKWIAPKLDEEGIVSHTWKPSYFDEDESVPIWKVDSHQLNSEGTKIKNVQRYANLTPNFFLLHCNHVADRCAELFTKPFTSSSVTADTIQLPSSNLRFFVTWDGFNIDRHISDFIHEKLQDERIKRLKQRATQGLPWRIIPTSIHSWKEIKSMKGYFRSLSGFTKTHSRSIYKSVAYKKGWIEETRKDGDSENTTVPTGKPTKTSEEWTKALTSCKWCSNPGQVKGNRYHTLLHCQHEHLMSFRSNMHKLLEQQLKELVTTISETQNIIETNKFLCSIETTLYSLHGLAKDKEASHLTYRDRDTWCVEEGCSMKELLTGNVPIYAHIFGMIPVSELTWNNDKELNQAHCIALGVIPKKVEDNIKILGQNLSKHYKDKDERKRIRGVYWKLWNKVKEIQKAGLVGLHMIIGCISTDMEKDLRKKHGIDIHYGRAASKVTEAKEDKGITSILRKRDRFTEADFRITGRLKKRVRFSFTKISTKTCVGISCSPDLSINQWASSAFSANKIEQKAKHCARCSKHQTALKKSILVLQQCKVCPDKEKVNNLIEYMDDHRSSINYKTAFQHIQSNSKLESNHGPKKRIIGEKKCKRGLSDPQKLLVTTLGKSIQLHSNNKDNNLKRISDAQDTLEKVSKKAKQFLKDDQKLNIDIINEYTKEKSYNQKHITIKSTDGRPPIREKVWASSSQQKKLRNDMMTTRKKWEYMEGRILNMALQKLRFDAPKGVHIASADAATDMTSWSNNEAAWKIFSRSFRDVQVCARKPHGTYLIPMFTGDTRKGHWYLVVINKQQKSCRGWVIDSLNWDHTKDATIGIIGKAFSKSRMKCKWMKIRTWPQTEAECGSRVIGGMLSICNKIARGGSVEHGIDAAIKGLAVGTSSMSYDADMLRKQAAELLNHSEEVRAFNEERNRAIRRLFKQSNPNGNSKESEDNIICIE